MKDLGTLKAAIAAALADTKMKAEYDAAGNLLRTHCNAGAVAVGKPMGCRELEDESGSPICADDQYAVMAANKSGKWNKVFGAAASLWAQQGGLSYAAMTSKMLTERAAQAALAAGKPFPKPDAHGHIDALSPEPMQMSGSLGHPVPMVCNIGLKNQDEKESEAFPVACGEADYFIWMG